MLDFFGKAYGHGHFPKVKNCGQNSHRELGHSFNWLFVSPKRFGVWKITDIDRAHMICAISLRWRAMAWIGIFKKSAVSALSQRCFKFTIASKAIHRRCIRFPCFSFDSLIPNIPIMNMHVSKKPLKPIKSHGNPSKSTCSEYWMTKTRTKYKITTKIPVCIEINKYFFGFYAYFRCVEKSDVNAGWDLSWYKGYPTDLLQSGYFWSKNNYQTRFC